MADDRKLGKGLDFLIKRTAPASEPAPVQAAEVLARRIPVEAIIPNPYQPRRTFGVEELNDLIESIRMHGVLQPIAVRPADGGRFELVAGERRWRACNELGLETIPAVVEAISDQDMLERALIENVQRADLDPIEKARAYRRLIDEFGLTQEEAAHRVSQKRSTVANYLRLLDLSDPIQSLVSQGELSMGHARALLALDPARREAVAGRAAREKLTVRQLEQMARQVDRPDGSPGRRSGSPHLEEVRRRLQDALGTRVSVLGSDSRGRIVIDYATTEALNRILELIEGAGRSEAGA